MLFCPEMALAACSGRKTVTRRIFKGGERPAGAVAVSAGKTGLWRWSVSDAPTFAGPRVGTPMPLQTTWRVDQAWDAYAHRNLPPEAAMTFWHAGMDQPPPPSSGRNRASMFVPTQLRPLLPRIVIRSARVELLQEITEEEAALEGIAPSPTRREGFAAIIDRLNGRGTWASNPLVWRIQFDLVT